MHALALSSLRAIVSSGMAFTPATKQALLERLPGLTIVDTDPMPLHPLGDEPDEGTLMRPPVPEGRQASLGKLVGLFDPRRPDHAERRREAHPTDGLGIA